jgi:hypothetical protein
VDLLGMGDEEAAAAAAEVHQRGEGSSAAAASASVQEALASAADRAQGVHVRAQMRALFEEMDTDGDGALSGGEIAELAARLGVGTLDEAVSDIPPPSLLLLLHCCCCTAACLCFDVWVARCGGWCTR